MQNEWLYKVSIISCELWLLVMNAMMIKIVAETIIGVTEHEIN